MSESSVKDQYQCRDHPDALTRLAIRARDESDRWGTTQVVECLRCGGRWSV